MTCGISRGRSGRERDGQAAVMPKLNIYIFQLNGQSKGNFLFLFENLFRFIAIHGGTGIEASD